MHNLCAVSNVSPCAPLDESPFTLIKEELLSDDIPLFQHEINLALDAQSPYLTDVERQMFAGGKKIRPVVMLLAARMVSGAGPLSLKVHKGAASLEMLHVATLIHDDIVDDAALRRGLPSVSAARGIKTALLVGAGALLGGLHVEAGERHERFQSATGLRGRDAAEQL